jgi:hypothetical protein
VNRLVDDLDAVVGIACHRLVDAADRDWDVPATRMTWTCRATVEHVADDLLSYAGQLAVRSPELDDIVPFLYWSDPAAGEHADRTAVHADPDAGNLGLVRVLDACRGMLSAVARTASPATRGFHVFGVSDPPGFAAMGTVETLLHLSDVAGPLGFAWDPDRAVVRRVLDRLFPDVPAEGAPWPTLLRATGRDPAVPLDTWRWDASVR